MDNYQIIQQLEKGGHSVSYLVTSNIDGQKCVLKKIECIDESAANKAFREIQALFKLSQSYISFPFDAFVTWDKEVSGMFVCVVSPFYERGNLLTFIKEKRSKKQKIEETQVVRWLSELVAAVSYLHKLSMPHRNLKPSNIYFVRETDIVLGDCGTDSIMADVQMRTRQTKGAMDWMAPETMEQPFNFDSDIWSLGCIMLELMTCGIWETAEMAGHLYEIKHSKTTLDNLLEEVAKHYSNDLVSQVKSMLSYNASDRPGIHYLAETPFIKNCLDELLEATKLKKVTMLGKSKPLPQPLEIDALLQYISLNRGDVSCVLNGLNGIYQLSADNVLSPSSESKYIILTCLEAYEDFADIQNLGCLVLAQLVTTAQQDDPIYHPRMASILAKALKVYANSKHVLTSVLALMVPVATLESSAVKLGREGALQSIAAILQKFYSDSAMCTVCCNAIWALTSIDENLRLATDEKIIYHVISTLQNHSDDVNVLEACSAAFVSLALKDDNIAVINETCCLGMLLDSLNTGLLPAGVVSKACLLLSILIEANEESAYQMLSAPKPDGKEIAGIPVIVKLYAAHRDNADVVKNLVAMVAELTEYNDIASELKHMDITSKMLSEVKRRFGDRPEIKIPCDTAMHRVL